MTSPLCRALALLTTPAAMAVTLALSAIWAAVVGTWAGVLDAVLSGGGVVFAQAIYREGSPRDDALHRKLDSIIQGTDADDALMGLERKGS